MPLYLPQEIDPVVLSFIDGDVLGGRGVEGVKGHMSSRGTARSEQVVTAELVRKGFSWEALCGEGKW